MAINTYYGWDQICSIRTISSEPED